MLDPGGETQKEGVDPGKSLSSEICAPCWGRISECHGSP